MPLMAEAAELFRERLRAAPDCRRLPMPETVPFSRKPPASLRWDNELLTSRSFRRAHVEMFHLPERLSVLHVCVFPHLDDPASIFGFDMIAGQSRVTGIFLDLSPVTQHPPVPGLHDVLGGLALTGFAARRTLPAWGDIFSGDVLAIRPIDMDEVWRAIDLARKALDGVLAEPRRPPDNAAAAGQARYIRGQRQNEHTLRMLANLIGPDPARSFIDQVLFPMDMPVSAGREIRLRHSPVAIPA